MMSQNGNLIGIGCTRGTFDLGLLCFLCLKKIVCLDGDWSDLHSGNSERQSKMQNPKLLLLKVGGLCVIY